MRTLYSSLVLLLTLAATPALAQGAPEASGAYVYFSEATELRVQLPAGWEGTQAVDETALPGRATYRWKATSAPLADAVVIVERVVGLNPLMQERWRRGQAASGYNGLRPTGAVPEDGLAFGPGAAFEIASGERLGRVFFVQRGEVFWSVHISAPAAAATPALLDALARGVRVSAKTVTPQQASR